MEMNMYRKLKNDDGAALVEFALIAVLLFTLIFGTIEAGLILYNQQVITNAGREGARHGVVSRPNGWEIEATAIETVVKNFAENHIVSFGSKNFIVNPQFESGSTHCTDFQEALTVDVTYEYSFLFLPFAKKTLGTRAVMYCE